MPSWFVGTLTTTVPFVVPAEVTLDEEVDALRIVDATGAAPDAVEGLAGVLGETERFTVTDDAPVAVTLVAVQGELAEVVGTFRVTRGEEILDEATLRAADPRALGVAAGQRIAPHRAEAERTLYTTGSPALKAAAAQVAAGDWAGAVATWRQVVTEGSRKDVARARHDLAVAAERAGRLDWALQLVRNAEPDLGPTTHVYVASLEQRWVDAKALKQQLPETDGMAERPDGQARGDYDPSW